MNLYDFVVPGADSAPVDLWELNGRVVLVALLPGRAEPSPRAEGLQRLATTFDEPGLTVLGVPITGGPGGSGYGVTFPVVAPQSPDGALLTWVTDGAGASTSAAPAFTRFLVGRDGELVGRFAADGDAKELIAAVQEQLARPVPPTPERPVRTPTDQRAVGSWTTRTDQAGLPAVLEPAPVGADGRAILDAELVVDDETEAVDPSTQDAGPLEDRLAAIEQQVEADRLASELGPSEADPSTGRDLQDLSDDLRDLEIDAQLRQE